MQAPTTQLPAYGSIIRDIVLRVFYKAQGMFAVSDLAALLTDQDLAQLVNAFGNIGLHVPLQGQPLYQEHINGIQRVLFCLADSLTGLLQQTRLHYWGRVHSQLNDNEKDLVDSRKNLVINVLARICFNFVKTSVELIEDAHAEGARSSAEQQEINADEGSEEGSADGPVNMSSQQIKSKFNTLKEQFGLDVQIETEKLLLDNRLDTAFWQACKTCNMRDLTKALALGANVNTKNAQGISALQIALQQGHMDVVNRLLRLPLKGKKLQVKLAHRDGAGYSLLMSAVKVCPAAVLPFALSALCSALKQTRRPIGIELQLFLPASDPNYSGWPVLHVACARFKREPAILPAIKYLLKQGADPNQMILAQGTVNHRRNALHIAVQNSAGWRFIGRKASAREYVALMSLLLKYNANAIHADAAGKRPAELTKSKEVHALLQQATKQRRFELFDRSQMKGEDLLSKVEQCLLHHPYVSDLLLTKNDIPAPIAVRLFDLIRRHGAINKIDLWHNQIGHDGAIALAEYLKETRTLHELIINENQLDEVAAIELADGLEINQSLEMLDIGYNEIGNKATIAIARALMLHPTLKNLRTGGNVITDLGGAALLELVCCNKQIIDFDINEKKDRARPSLAMVLAINLVIQRNLKLQEDNSAITLSDQDKTVLWQAVQGDPRGDYLWHYLAKGGYYHALQWLWDNRPDDADCDVRNNYGDSALHYAVETRDSIEAVKFLVDEVGMSPAKPNNNGACPLWLAAGSAQNSVIVSYLLSILAQDDINTVDNRLQQTALHRAAACGDIQTARFLLEAGIPINTVDALGKSALIIACEQGYVQIAEFAEVLIKYHADVTITDAKGCTALHYAAKHVALGSEYVVSLLLKAGANPNAKNNAAESPRIFAYGNDKRQLDQTRTAIYELLGEAEQFYISAPREFVAVDQPITSQILHTKHERPLLSQTVQHFKELNKAQLKELHEADKAFTNNYLEALRYFPEKAQMLTPLLSRYRDIYQSIYLGDLDAIVSIPNARCDQDKSIATDGINYVRQQNAMLTKLTNNLDKKIGYLEGRTQHDALTGEDTVMDLLSLNEQKLLEIYGTQEEIDRVKKLMASTNAKAKAAELKALQERLSQIDNRKRELSQLGAFCEGVLKRIQDYEEGRLYSLTYQLSYLVEQGPDTITDESQDEGPSDNGGRTAANRQRFFKSSRDDEAAYTLAMYTRTFIASSKSLIDEYRGDLVISRIQGNRFLLTLPSPQRYKESPFHDINELQDTLRTLQSYIVRTVGAEICTCNIEDNCLVIKATSAFNADLIEALLRSAGCNFVTDSMYEDEESDSIMSTPGM